MGQRKLLGAALAFGAISTALVVLTSCSAQSGFGGADDCDYLVFPGTSQGAPLPPGTQLSAFVLDHYDVTYRNLSNGGGTVPGVDVPFPIQVSLAAVPTVPPASFTFNNFEMLFAGQKQQPPLNDSSFYPAAGMQLEATLTFWGWPAVDPSAACFGTLRYIITVFDGGGC
jgi:hypothetical protein